MPILAIETSSRTASVALSQQDQVVAELHMPAGKRTAAWLAVAVRDLLQQCEIAPQKLEAIALSHGPGSFTGLRIGVTFAKVFAYTLQESQPRSDESVNLENKPHVIPVNTLEVVAAQAETGTPSVIHAVMDAGRNEVFHASFQLLASEEHAAHSTAPTRSMRSKSLGQQTPTCIAQPPELAARIKTGEYVVGNGTPLLEGHFPAGVNIVSESRWQPHAATVSHVAWQRFWTGDFGDVWQLAPAYLRPSYAEESRSK